MSELEQLLSSKTTMELKLEEVMSTVPVNMSQLVKIKIGKNCNTEILSKLDSDEQEMVATMAEQLKASLELMSMDERKSVFHDCLNECSIEIQRALDNSASSRANFNWVPHDLSHELLSIVTDKWDQARSLYQNFLDEDKSRQRKWTAVSEDISREFTPGATSQPELEHDSLEEKKLGWNREWTWRRRAQFNWGVETLMSGLETKDEFHTEARRRIELLSNHIPVVEGCKQALKSVIDAFWNITSDRAPRAYQHSIAGAIDNKQNFIKELSSDVEYIEKELAMVHNGNLQQRKNFEDTEVTGGTAMVALLAEYKTLNQQLTSLPIEKEEAIVEPTSRLADLKNQREEEVQRALKKSQDYLSENMQLQNECKEQLEKIEAKFKQREADVESKIRDNEDKQRLAEEEHHKQAVKRLDNEAKRCEVIKQLITDAEELIQRYKKTIETNEAELSYPKATLIPFSHSFTLTLLNCQRDYLVGLSDYEDIVPNHMIELIKPSFVLRSRLCSSLIQACNDIDEVLEACKVQIEFCNETQDPKRDAVTEIQDNIKRQRADFLQEIAEVKDSMDRDDEVWEKLGKSKEELWQAVLDQLGVDDTADVMNASNVIPGGTTSPKRTKARERIKFPSSSVPKGFHLPCKLRGSVQTMTTIPDMNSESVEQNSTAARQLPPIPAG